MKFRIKKPVPLQKKQHVEKILRFCLLVCLKLLLSPLFSFLFNFFFYTGTEFQLVTAAHQTVLLSLSGWYLLKHSKLIDYHCEKERMK